jgi:hypothetical protein
MIHPVSIEALPGYRIHVRYSDGAEGEIDLSDFAGKELFAAWRDPKFFQQVHIGEHRQIRWDDNIELCPDAMYMRLTGKTPEEYFAMPASEPAHA